MKNRNIEHRNDWATPDSVFNFIEKELWFKKKIFFDPCPFTHDIEKWDWLKIDWKGYNFINPPYELKLKTSFVKKAIEEAKKWNTCIMLLPVSTSTKLFHDYILPNQKNVIFLKGRVKFSGWNTKGEWVSDKCGMHDSMIVVF